MILTEWSTSIDRSCMIPNDEHKMSGCRTPSSEFFCRASSLSDADDA